MLMIIADYHDDPYELSGRRERFTAAEFAFTIELGKRSGSVLLIPEKRSLRVSSSSKDFERIRVFNENGNLLGTMACSPTGTVSWVAPQRP
jgi:hypothetical protein